MKAQAMPDSDTHTIIDVISIVVTAAVSFFGGKRLSNAQANKLFTEEEIARRNFEKQERNEYMENAIRYKKMFDNLDKEVEVMRNNFTTEVAILKSEIVKLRNELDLITRKYNLEKTFNSSIQK